MKKIILLLVILSAFLTPFASAQEDSVREKVEQKIEDALQNPKAYIGTVTDIGENSLQLNKFTFGDKENGDILQVKTTQETSIVKTTKTSISIEFDEIAIGDFVIAMGHVNDKEILDTLRIVVSTPIEVANRTAIFGTVTEVTDSTLIVATKAGEITVDPAKLADFTQRSEDKITNIKFSKFAEGDKIIASGKLDEETLAARIVHLVSSDSQQLEEE